MNRFNLTFSGEIQTGQAPDDVKLRFAKKFAIDDPDRVERFFSGQPIILRRNLDRKEAAECFQDMQRMGLVTELVKVTAQEAAAQVTGQTTCGQADAGKGGLLARSKRKKTAKTNGTDVANGSPRPSPAPSSEAQLDFDAAQAQAAAAESARQAAEQETEQLRREKDAEQQARERLGEEQSRIATLQEEERAAARAAEKARQEAEAANEELRAERERERTQQRSEQAKLKADREQANERQAALAASAEEANAAREEAARVAREREESHQQAIAQAARQAEQEAAARRRAEEEEQRATAEREAARQAREEAEALTRRNRELEQERAAAASRAAELEAQLAAEREREAQRLAREQAAEDAAAHKALEEQAVERAAGALAGGAALGPARASVKTSLELPQRSADAPARKRQPGEPNLYTLQAFRNRPEVQQRAELAAVSARRFGIVGAVALALLLVLTGAYLGYQPKPVPATIGAAVSNNSGELLLLAGQALYLHDRSGTPAGTASFTELGVTGLSTPMAYEDTGTLLAIGTLAGEASARLLRCQLQAPACTPLPALPAAVQPSALVVEALSGQLLLVDGASGSLLKTTPEGEVVASANPALPRQPFLALSDGLLLVNSAGAPAISVLRHDAEAFGQQLDEVMLLPTEAIDTGRSRVADFQQAAGDWWVTLFNPDSGDAGLYRFDSQWNYLGEATLPLSSADLQLARLGDKTLVNSRRGTTLARYNPQGMAEAALQSEPLQAQLDAGQRQRQLTETAWRIALILCGLLALAALAYAALQYLRSVVYRPSGERGAEPVDDYLAEVRWIEHAQGRTGILRTRAISYGLVSAALLLLAMGQQAGSLQVAALMLFLAGPGVALALFARSSPGHIGSLRSNLLLVEPAGLYHLDAGPRVLHRAGFVFIDDVALFTGNALLPAFDRAQLASEIQPLLITGTEVDARTVIVRLLQSRHPLARGALAIGVFSLGALSLLMMQGIF